MFLNTDTGGARYLFSPVIAGFLLALWDVKLLLVIDICTFFLTIISAAVVRKGIDSNEILKNEPFLKSITEGWHVIRDRNMFPVSIKKLETAG